MASSNLRFNSKFNYTQSSTTGNIMAVPGIVHGVFVSAASGSPSITIYDSTATATTTKVVDTFTPVAATYYPLGDLYLTKGCYVVLANTVSATFATASNGAGAV